MNHHPNSNAAAKAKAAAAAKAKATAAAAHTIESAARQTDLMKRCVVAIPQLTIF